jgi:hypothetical protein
VKPTDLPRNELIERAGEAVAMFKAQGVEAYVNFKFNCEKCGFRCTFTEPNTIYEYGDCCMCGHRTKVVEGGFALTANLASRQL